MSRAEWERARAVRAHNLLRARLSATQVIRVCTDRAESARSTATRDRLTAIVERAQRDL